MWRIQAVLAAGLALSACADPVLRPAAPAPLATYVVVGEAGQQTARAIVTGPSCPQLSVDGRVQAMRTRAPAGTAPLRPRQAKASEFPVLVCEAPLPAQAASARIAGRDLALLAPAPRRVVVIGDTGCRIKASEKAFQRCSDPSSWPFAAVADAAAREHPDLVVHVGDYHYRETPCPPEAGCADSPWGYGWDAWNADLFRPAAPLLQAAPWVLVRGNHEECARAGQGWFRMLDPQAFEAQRSCDSPDADAQADFSRPYAVPLDLNWQLVIFDSARASRPLDPAKPEEARILERYREDLRVVAALAAPAGMHSIFLSHHPVLGFSPNRSGETNFGNPALLAAMKSVNGVRYYPPGIDAALHGHVHLFQAIDFASAHPAAIVAGHGGDNLDTDLPDTLPATYSSAEGVQLDFVAHASTFGYLVLDRNAEGWSLRAMAVDGSSLASCKLIGEHLDCATQGKISRPRAAAGTASR